MKNRIKVFLISLLMLCAGGNLFAGDSHNYDLTGIAPIWDISGTYSEDIDGMSVALTLAQDSAGKIRGGGSWSASEDGITMSANVAVKGVIKKSKGIATISVKITHKGVATDGIKRMKFSVTQQINAEIDEELLEMTGKIRTSISMPSYKDSFTEYWNEDLPIGMDGSCSLDLDTTATAKGIAGSAVLNLSNLETVNFAVKGSNKKGTVKLSLKGSKSTGDSGASLSVEIDAFSGMLRTIKGKVLGQAVSGSPVSEPFYYGGGSASISVIGGPTDPFEPHSWY